MLGETSFCMVAETATVTSKQVGLPKAMAEVIILATPAFVVVTETIDSQPMIIMHHNNTSSVHGIRWQPAIALNFCRELRRDGAVTKIYSSSMLWQGIDVLNGNTMMTLLLKLGSCETN